MSYFSIHNHTEYSSIRVLDSTIRTEDLINKAIELGLSGVCITDHELLCSHVQAIQHYKTLPQEVQDRFTLGLGDEIYLVNDLEPSPEFGYAHFVLVAKNSKGHRALREISSTAWDNSVSDRGFRTPISKEQLEAIIKKYPNTIKASSACLGSELSKLTIKLIERENFGGDVNEIKSKIVSHINYCKRVFGEDFYVEVQPGTTDEQHQYNKRIKPIAKALGVKMVFTTDSHYLTKEDRKIHKAYLNSSDGDREVDDFYSTTYLMSKDEAYDYLKADFTLEEFNEMVDNTNEFKAGIEFYDLFQPQVIPEVEIDVDSVSSYLSKYNGGAYDYINKMINSEYDQDRFWIGNVLKGYEEKTLLKKPYLNQETYLERINTEAMELWEISIKLHDRMTKYYNTMAFLIGLMWDAGAMVGIARGSATGFLTNYYIDIIQIDPIEWDLPHWRHLSAERPELADIDVDTPASKRDAVLQATIDYFGEDNVLNIATFGTEGGRSAVLTACRGLEIDVDTAQYLSSLIPLERGQLWSLSDVVNGNVEKGRRPVKAFLETVAEYDGLLEVITSIEGLVNKRSIHASGVYIYNNGFLEHNAMMKSPNGQKTTQFNMGDSDYMGSLKYDYLTIEALDKMTVCVDMLIKDGLMECQGSLKSTYDKYLHPDALRPKDEELWKLSWTGEVLDLFQFSTIVGLNAMRQVKATNMIEAAHVNSLMRLKAEPGQINPVIKYNNFRADISLWYKEMAEYGLSKSEVSTMEKYLKAYYGVSATQEDVMKILMDEEVCGLNVKDVNKVRKAIAKKKANLLEEAHQMIIKSCSSQNLVNYIWDKVVMPQAGYAFSINHTTPYTGIALQELTLYANYPSIYWNTACLTVNSASDDEDGGASDYGKIATAIGAIKSRGISVSTLDINKSDFGFKPDVENNTILFGLKGVTGIGDDVVHSIIENRPYSSLKDFVSKTKMTKSVIIPLIKGGAFDSLHDNNRKKIMIGYLMTTCGAKSRVNLQNFRGLVANNLIPEELDFERRVYNFNAQLKKSFKSKNHYNLSEQRFYDFYAKNFDVDVLEINDSGVPCIECGVWDRMYQVSMDTVRYWLAKNQESILMDYNALLLKEEVKNYADGSLAKWEMDSLCFYHSAHELDGIDIDNYGISELSSLPTEPVVDRYFKKDGRDIPLMKLTRIAGTCIDKDKTKSTVTLLTTTGVITVKMPAEVFARYNRQIKEDSKIVEPSWFARGNMIVVNGFRTGEQFMAKKYASTVGHMIYKIDDISLGKLIMRSNRWGEEVI